MKKLNVMLDYGRANNSGHQPPSARQSDLVLPLRVMDSDGSVVAEGAVGSRGPASLDVSAAAEGNLFVRLTWPSGKTLTKKVIDAGVDGEVVFSDDALSRHEWAAWAVPRLNERVDLSEVRTQPIPERQKLEAFAEATVALWAFPDGGSAWVPAAIAVTETLQDEAALQFDTLLPQGSWLLQLRGGEMNSRFISLPSGACRVLVTPNESTDRRKEPLKAVVTGFRQDSENLLEFLSRDSMRAAASLARYDGMAVRLLGDAASDPFAALAGAYYLVRTDWWRDAPIDGFRNLHQAFPALADTALIYLTVLVRKGLATEADEAEAGRLFAQAEALPYPVYSEAMRLLQEVASVLRFSDMKPAPGVFSMVQNLVAAKAWAGSSFSFYGESPSRPAVPGRKGSALEEAATPHPNAIRLLDMVNAPRGAMAPIESSQAQTVGARPA